jgi:hypothetical protein
MKMAVFWVQVYQRFIALMIEAVWASETPANVHQSTWRYNPEDSHLRLFPIFADDFHTTWLSVSPQRVHGPCSGNMEATV